MGQRFQFPELARIGENDACQPPSIDHAISEHVGPAASHGPKRLALRLEDPMAHSVCIDDSDPFGSQQSADLRLP